jgi:hypothetical protein
MGIEEEREFLFDQFFGIRQVVLPSEEELRQVMSKAYGRELSLTYMRRLLDRHSLMDLIASEEHKAAAGLSRKWKAPVREKTASTAIVPSGN